MSTMIGEKIRAIRECEGLSRPKFCEATGVNKETLVTAENGRYEPKVGLVEQVCAAFPQYTLWLMTGQVNPEGGQISPEIKLQADQLKTG